MAKKLSKGFWNMLFSTVDPELQALAQKIRAYLPEDSRHSKLTGRIFGIIKAFAESKAEGMSPILSAVVEKLTDLGDFISASSEDGGKKAAVDWMDKFFKEAGERLKSSSEPEKEFQKILLEFKLRQRILKVIEKTRKGAQPKTTPSASINWETELNKLKKLMTRVAKSLNEKAAKIAPHIRQFRLCLEERGIKP